MSLYIHGNVALEERESVSRGTAPKSVAKKVYKTKGLPGREKLLWLSGAVLCCAIAGVYQFGVASTYEINSQIVKAESEIRQLEEENASLKNEIAKLQKPERLIESGIQLGLVERSELPALATGTGSAVAYRATE